MKQAEDLSLSDLMRPAKTISQNATLFEALKKMIDEKTNSLVVVDDEGKLVGLLNSGMLLKQVVPEYLKDDLIASHFANIDILKDTVEKAKDKKVSEFMIKDPAYLTENAGLVEAMVLALTRKYMRIPVVDENMHVKGLITRTELKRALATLFGIGDFE